MPSLTDEQCIEKVLRGETQCFEEVVKRFEKPLFNIAYRMTHDREEARDITQEAFLSAYGELRQYSGKGTFASWLYRILANKCLNHIKHRKKIQFRGLEEAEEHQSASEKSDPPEECVKKEEAERLYQEMEKLSDRQRMILNLFYLAGFKYREIGEILSMSEALIKSDLFRARHTLRRRLDDLWKG